MRTAMSYLVLAVLAGALLAAPASAWAQTGPIQVTMAELLAGATIDVGDKHFYGFHGYSSNGYNGALGVDPTTMSATAYWNGTEPGLLFQSPSFSVTNGGSQDTHFEFYVGVLDSRFLISDNTLTMTAAAYGAGSNIHIAEVVAKQDETAMLANKLVSLTPDGGNNSDHKIFQINDVPTPVPAIHVFKDIGLVAGPGEGTNAFMSDFTQTFSQVPEPATLSLLALGGLGALLRRKRK